MCSAMSHSMTNNGTDRAYWQGYAAGRADERQYLLRILAERVDELDAVWRPIERKSFEEKVAERLALFEEAAERLAHNLAASAATSGDWPVVAEPGTTSAGGAP